MPATTPTYGLPYPAQTDPPNGPGQLKALAEAVEATLTARALPTRVYASETINGGSVGGGTMQPQFANMVLSTLTIADPGHRYRLVFNGVIFIDPGDSTGLNISVRDGTTLTGALLSFITPIDGAVSGTKGGLIAYPIAGASPPLTGARSISLCAIKFRGGGGDGWTHLGHPQTGWTATVTPAEPT